MALPAVCYSIALLALLMRGREYPAWGGWILTWAIVVATWDPLSRKWLDTIYNPFLMLASLLLALSCMEAYFAYASHFHLTVSISRAIALIGISAGWAMLYYYDAAPAIQRYSLSLRVGCASFMVLSLAFWASCGWIRWTNEFRHFLVVMLMAASFTAGSFIHTRVGWFAWWNTDALLHWSRAVLLIGWAIAIPRWRSAGAQSAIPLETPLHGSPAASASRR